MRKYTGEQILQKVICNKCGRELLVENGILKEDVFEGRHAFGFFSKKDGIIQEFDMCEACFTYMLSELKVPPCESERIEFL